MLEVFQVYGLLVLAEFFKVPFRAHSRLALGTGMIQWCKTKETVLGESIYIVPDTEASSLIIVLHKLGYVPRDTLELEPIIGYLFRGLVVARTLSLGQHLV